MKKVVTLMCLAMLFFAACQKDNGIGNLRLMVENPRPHGKVYVGDGNYAWFNLGDQIRVNGYTFRMAAPKSSGSNPVYNVDVDEDMLNRQPNYYDVFYPGVGSSYDPTNRIYTLELNATQPYVEDGDGNQKIPCVMAGTAGVSDESTMIQMKNLTALLRVTINPPAAGGGTYYLKSITVRATDNTGKERYFAGKYTVDMSATTLKMVQDVSSTPVEGAQQMVLTVPEEDGAIAAGGSKSFYVAVPPMENNVKFTVMIYGKLVTASKTSKVIATVRHKNFTDLLASEIGPIVFNSVAEGEGQLPYLYTVAADASGNPTKKVRFSIGNLQYKRGGTHQNLKEGTVDGTWRFAENQYDYIGSGNSKITQLEAGTNTIDWIDLFGWCTGQHKWVRDNYQPYEYGGAHNDYGCNGSTDAIPIEYDWACNEISNGGGVASMSSTSLIKWYTMPVTEWNYVVSGSSTSGTPTTVTTNARYKCNSLATVCGVKGIILLPDYSWSKNWNKYVNPISCAPFVPNEFTNFNANVYNQEQWDEMEAAGAVFLPAGGRRIGTSITGYSNATSGSGLVYVWTTSTPSQAGGNSAVVFQYDPSNHSFGVAPGNQNRHYGASVRLVYEVPQSQW